MLEMTDLKESDTWGEKNWILSQVCHVCVNRHGKALPADLIPHPNGTLEFRRPLSLSDSGTYQCVARNEVGVGTAGTLKKVIGMH